MVTRVRGMKTSSQGLSSFLSSGHLGEQVQHLEEVGSFCLHTRVHIGLSALDVVVQVVCHLCIRLMVLSGAQALVWQGNSMKVIQPMLSPTAAAVSFS